MNRSICYFRRCTGVFAGFKRWLSFDKAIEKSSNHETYHPKCLLGLPVASTDDIYRLSRNSIHESSIIINGIKSDNYDIDNILTDFDNVSNKLCRIADWCECVRNVHPSPSYRKMAEACSSELVAFVEKLNCDPHLYQILSRFYRSKKDVCHETKSALESLILDFEHSGINLKENVGEFLSIHRSIYEKSSKFVSSCESAFQRGNNFQVNYQQFELLDSILMDRKRYANQLDFDCYADLVVKRSMAKSTETVLEFLEKLASSIEPLIEETVRQLSTKNKQFSHSYVLQSLTDRRGYNNPPAPFSVPLSSFLNSLDHLFQGLFGIQLAIDEAVDNSVWSSSVMKINVVNVKTKSIIGSFFLDLFPRPLKPSFSCHYTLAGRKVDGDGVQLPCVYVTLNLPMYEKSIKNSDRFIDLDGASTILHEIGHTFHSILYTGRYQHLSGTRCSTDMAEIPSILFEKFLNDQDFLSSLAPSFRKQTNARKDKEMHLIELHKTCIDSIVDIKLHSKEYNGNSTEIIEKTLSRFRIHGMRSSVSEYQYFSHFIHYAAKYYSYIWAESCASLIWDRVFKKSVKNKEGGNTLKKELLQNGGIYDGEALMKKLLLTEIEIKELVDALLSD